jgi:hypothetical protein
MNPKLGHLWQHARWAPRAVAAAPKPHSNRTYLHENVLLGVRALPSGAQRLPQLTGVPLKVQRLGARHTRLRGVGLRERRRAVRRRGAAPRRSAEPQLTGVPLKVQRLRAVQRRGAAPGRSAEPQTRSDALMQPPGVSHPVTHERSSTSRLGFRV